MQNFIELDRQFFLILNNLGSPAFDHFWLLISSKWIWLPLYAIFLFLLAKNYKLKSLLFILLFIAVGIAISDQMAGIFKVSVQRLRPYSDENLIGLMRQPFISGNNYGFYSAHASSSFFIASFLTVLLKKKFGWFPYFLFFWAFIVSYSRIYLGVHFPLDVEMGATIGFLLGGLFAALAKKAIYKH